MQVELEDTPAFDFTTRDPVTGAATDADTTPTCAIYEGTSNSAILTPTCVTRGSAGQYYVAPACTTANGFEEGKWYNVVVTATVAGVVGKYVAATFQIVTLVPRATVVSNVSNTSSTFETDLTESTTDYWKDALLLFVTGSLKGQVKKVSGYDGSTKFVTLSSAFTAAPSAADSFILINR